MGRDELRVAVIGNGRWGAHYVRILGDLPGACVEIACDLDAARLPRHGARRVSTDWRASVTDARVDAVIVATPAASHFEIARFALDAGKHVLVEKPLTTRVDHGNALQTAAAERNVVLMVGHIYLFHDGLRRLEQTVTAPTFGAIRYLKATRTHQGPVRTDVNVVWDLASHDVAIFRHLLGRQPQAVCGVSPTAPPGEQESFAFIRLWYEQDVEAHIHVSWNNRERVREVVVVGEHACAVFDECRPAGDLWMKRRRNAIIDLPSGAGVEPLRQQCAHFLACIDGASPLCPAPVGIDVVKVLEAVSRSIRARGEVTPLE